MEFITWLVAALFGAGIMYLLDPQQGKGRRETLREHLITQSRKWRDSHPHRHDVINQAIGKIASLQESNEESKENILK